MVRKVFLIFCLILIPCQTPAVDWGLIIWVYMCNGSEIAEKTVNSCISQYPELKSRGAAALDSWRHKNANYIRRGKEACDTELQKHFPTETQLVKARVQIEELKREHLNALNSKIVNGGVIMCEDFLSRIEKNTGDSPLVFPVE
jgi:hypothetical protein